MSNEKEIAALIKLLSDPDEEVQSQVHYKIISYGREIIAPMELAWEQSFDLDLQQKIENIIHQIHFNEVKTKLLVWAQTGAEDLLEAALIINTYQYPDIDIQNIKNKIGEIKLAIWTEMYYPNISSLEKVQIINHIFFSKFGFAGNISQHYAPENSYLSQVLESKKGNQISLAILYSSIAQQLDIPIFGVNLPQHFVLAYMDMEQVLFYINPFNKGQIFGKHDVDQFLKQLKLDRLPEFYQPCSHTDIIKRVLRNLITAYEKTGNIDKKEEINTLLNIISG